MSDIREYIITALKNIKANKGRSLLTMLGIIIGISSVIMVMTVGGGVKEQMNSELENLAGGQIYLSIDNRTSNLEFTIEDFSLIGERVENIRAVTPNLGGRGVAEGTRGSFECSITAGNEGLIYAYKEPIISGRYFTQEDVTMGNRVGIITESSARLLFGTTNVLGMPFELSLNGILGEITIIGIRKDSASSIITSASLEQVTVELPYTVIGDEFQYGIETFSNMFIIANSSKDSSEVAKKSVALLEYKYSIKGENKIKVENFSDVTSEMNKIMDIVTLFISFVAAISLLVGGIGVMNIMLVSVTERTREIGIRKALGARTGSILLQFLAEAAMITLIGGIIGIFLGTMGGIVICKLAKVVPGVSVGTVLSAAMFSTAVGLFFGIYPAKKAAKLSPIEALRHE